MARASRTGFTRCIGVVVIAAVAAHAAARAANAQPASTLPAGLARWTLAAQPVIRIGSESDTSAQFQRIVGVMRMASGEIVVANAGTSELRVFTPAGRFLRSLSRRGQGPGELENIGRILRAGDTVLAIELAPGAVRMSTFTLASGFGSRLAVRASNAPQGVSPLARLSTGELVVSRGTFRPVFPVAGALTRDTMTVGLLRVAEPPGAVVWFGDFPNNSWLGYSSPSMRNGVGFTRFPLGPSLVVAASGDRAWLGDSESGAITILDAAGRRVGQVQVPVRARPFVDAALARAKQAALADAATDDQKARWENVYGGSHRPRMAPLFTRFTPAPDGGMAIELFEEEDRAVARSTLVLDRNGQAVAGFVVPPNVVVHELGADYLLGVHFDPEGVEQVVQYRLQR